RLLGRLREVVALRGVAAELDEAIPDLCRLDVLGDDAQAEVAAEVDRRADDARVLLLLHRHHERAVDLDLVDRELEGAEDPPTGAVAVAAAEPERDDHLVDAGLRAVLDVRAVGGRHAGGDAPSEGLPEARRRTVVVAD